MKIYQQLDIIRSEYDILSTIVYISFITYVVTYTIS